MELILKACDIFERTLSDTEKEKSVCVRSTKIELNFLLSIYSYIYCFGECEQI